MPGIFTSRIARSGWCSCDQLHGLVAPAGLTDHLVAGREEDLLQIEPDDRFVFGDHDAGERSPRRPSCFATLLPVAARSAGVTASLPGRHGRQELVLSAFEIGHCSCAMRRGPAPSRRHGEPLRCAPGWPAASPRPGRARAPRRPTLGRRPTARRARQAPRAPGPSGRGRLGCAVPAGRDAWRVKCRWPETSDAARRVDRGRRHRATARRPARRAP